LSTKKFMEEYGNDVLDLYDIPMEEELERLDRNEDEDDEDDEEDITGDSDEDGE